MATSARPRCPNFYAEILLPASTRHTALRETQRDRDHLPAQHDPHPLGDPLTLRRARDIGTSPIAHGYTASELHRIAEAGRELRADLRALALAYMTLAATMPEGNS